MQPEQNYYVHTKTVASATNMLNQTILTNGQRSGHTSEAQAKLERKCEQA